MEIVYYQNFRVKEEESWIPLKQILFSIAFAETFPLAFMLLAKKVEQNYLNQLKETSSGICQWERFLVFTEQVIGKHRRGREPKKVLLCLYVPPISYFSSDSSLDYVIIFYYSIWVLRYFNTSHLQFNMKDRAVCLLQNQRKPQQIKFNQFHGNELIHEINWMNVDVISAATKLSKDWIIPTECGHCVWHSIFANLTSSRLN